MRIRHLAAPILGIAALAAAASPAAAAPPTLTGEILDTGAGTTTQIDNQICTGADGSFHVLTAVAARCAARR
jgi:hypothetical protein